MGADNLYELPSDLPIPIDDGACDHLPGMPVPEQSLTATSGRQVSLLDESRQRRTIVFCYPRTGQPDREPPPGWNEIPGARGCTPQACGFRDRHNELRSLATIFGLSTQDSAYQREMVKRLELPFEVLSDDRLEFTSAMRLPTFRVEEMTLLRRLTLILSQGRVEKVFYPVFPPDKSADDVLAWLRSNPSP